MSEVAAVAVMRLRRTSCCWWLGARARACVCVCVCVCVLGGGGHGRHDGPHAATCARGRTAALQRAAARPLPPGCQPECGCPAAKARSRHPPQTLTTQAMKPGSLAKRQPGCPALGPVQSASVHCTHTDRHARRQYTQPRDHMGRTWGESSLHAHRCSVARQLHRQCCPACLLLCGFCQPPLLHARPSTSSCCARQQRRSRRRRCAPRTVPPVSARMAELTATAWGSRGSRSSSSRRWWRQLLCLLQCGLLAVACERAEIVGGSGTGLSRVSLPEVPRRPQQDRPTRPKRTHECNRSCGPTACGAWGRGGQQMAEIRARMVPARVPHNNREATQSSCFD
jgi:hypothetical protein